MILAFSVGLYIYLVWRSRIFKLLLDKDKEGVIIDRANAFAEHYSYLAIGGKTYLAVEHKSGDYHYLCRVFGYYIFEKVT